MARRETPGSGGQPVLWVVARAGRPGACVRLRPPLRDGTIGGCGTVPGAAPLAIDPSSLRDEHPFPLVRLVREADVGFPTRPVLGMDNGCPIGNRRVRV